MSRNRPDISTLTQIALMAGLMAVCSWITIPAPVPFTMQTFGVFMAVGLLGGRKGTAAIILYLLLGTAGLPVFAGFSSGPGVIAGPLGGYLIGFIFSGLTMYAVSRLSGSSYAGLAIAMAAGLLVCYAFGTVWFIQVYPARTGNAVSLISALSLCVFPFIIPDAVKIGLASLLVCRLRPLIHDSK